MDFLGISKFNPVFHMKHPVPSEALGARLMCAFYQHDTLMARPHGQALKHIIEMVLSEPGSNDSMIVPIVIHFDEHKLSGSPHFAEQ